MELEADNWKHRSNYTVTLSEWELMTSSGWHINPLQISQKLEPM